MLKQSRLLVVSMLIILFTASGCLDLFAIPGVAVSPDGGTLYFLSGEMDILMSGDEFPSSLTAYNLSDGTSTVIAEGGADALISAFAVNPVNGAVAYVRTVDEAPASIDYWQDGASNVLVELPFESIGTMASFSPDGAYLAVTVVSFPEGADTENTEELTREQLDAITYGVYVVNLADGSAMIINDTSATRANTVAWSPDSTHLAYTAWMDTDGNGSIAMIPPFDMEAMMVNPVIDLAQTFIYNIADGSTSQVTTTSIDVAPIFITTDHIAFVALDYTNIMVGSLPVIAVYDLNSGDISTVYEAQELITGMALSPDGTQVAWIVGSTSDDGEETSAAEVYVAGIDFAAPQLVATLDGISLPDAPLWLDNDTVLVSASNILNGLAGSFSISFSTDEESVAESDIPLQQILALNVTDGTSEVLYEGAMINSSFTTSLLVLVDSGALEDMMGGF